ncbi:hypothetical protein Bca52824_026605 [Brassica carinata]|uniref:Uncharacterized protein n=1 Tax=Brassica carinata TaxID=52824 RepID=A0A8X7V972_BRACI|nr:hypothetical protein Bca52824_026605 [Brassica carinata]
MAFTHLSASSMNSLVKAIIMASEVGIEMSCGLFDEIARVTRNLSLPRAFNLYFNKNLKIIDADRSKLGLWWSHYFFVKINEASVSNINRFYQPFWSPAIALLELRLPETMEKPQFDLPDVFNRRKKVSKLGVGEASDSEVQPIVASSVVVSDPTGPTQLDDGGSLGERTRGSPEDSVRSDGRSGFNPHEDVTEDPIPQTSSVTSVPVSIPAEVMEMIEEGKRLQGRCVELHRRNTPLTGEILPAENLEFSKEYITLAKMTHKESLNERFTAERNRLRFSPKVTVLREKMFSCDDMKSECIRRMTQPKKYLAERDLSWMLVSSGLA